METSSASREGSCARLEPSGTHGEPPPPLAPASSWGGFGETEALSSLERAVGSEGRDICQWFESKPLAAQHLASLFLPATWHCGGQDPALRLHVLGLALHGGENDAWVRVRGSGAGSPLHPWSWMSHRCHQPCAGLGACSCACVCHRSSLLADKQVLGCKCHHRNRCYLKQTRALLTLKVEGFVHDERLGRSGGTGRLGARVLARSPALSPALSPTQRDSDARAQMQTFLTKPCSYSAWHAGPSLFTPNIWGLPCHGEHSLDGPTRGHFCSHQGAPCGTERGGKFSKGR